MAQYPDGVKFIIQSKNENQNYYQTEQEFIVDSANEYFEVNAYNDAFAVFSDLTGNYSATATKEFSLERCQQMGYEIRPVPISAKGTPKKG